MKTTRQLRENEKTNTELRDIIQQALSQDGITDDDRGVLNDALECLDAVIAGKYCYWRLVRATSDALIDLANDRKFSEEMRSAFMDASLNLESWPGRPMPESRQVMFPPWMVDLCK